MGGGGADLPGPGAYEAAPPGSGPAFSMGVGERPPLAAANPDVPGP